MKRVSVAAAIVGAVTLVLHTVPAMATERAIDGLVDDGGAAWLPTFGTVGETAMTYMYVSRVVAGLALVLPGLALGYYLAGDRDVRASFRRFVRDVAAGSTAGVFVTAVLFALVSGEAPIDAMTSGVILPVTIALALVGAFVEVALVVTVATLAGAAIAAFDTGPQTRSATQSGADARPGSGVRDD